MALSTEKVLGRRIKTSKLLISMLEITSLIRNTDLESSFGHLGILTKEIMSMMKERDMEKCFSLMVPHTKENGKEEFKMEKQPS